METTSAHIEPETIWNKNFICIMLANFMLSMGHSIVNPLVATYTKYLHASAQMTGFLTGMFFLIAFVCQPFAGPAMTKLDRRKMLIFVHVLGAVANTGYALFHSIPVFMVFRIFSGFQYSLFGPLFMALSGVHLPKSQLTYGLGIFGIASAVAAAVAPTIGLSILNIGIRIDNEGLGFTLMFLSASLMFILAIIPTVIIAPDKKTKEEIASTGAWYKNMLTKHAVPPAVIMLLLTVSYSIISVYIFEFAREQGITGANMFYLVLAVSLAVSRPLCGYITEKIGMTRIVFPAIVIFACAMLTIGYSSSLWMALIGAVLAAVGFGASQPVVQTMTLLSETTQRRSVASNTLYMGTDLGWFLGPLLGGFVYANSNYSLMYKARAIPLVLAIVCLLAVIPLYRKRLAELDRQFLIKTSRSE